MVESGGHHTPCWRCSGSTRDRTGPDAPPAKPQLEHAKTRSDGITQPPKRCHPDGGQFWLADGASPSSLEESSARVVPITMSVPFSLAA